MAESIPKKVCLPDSKATGYSDVWRRVKKSHVSVRRLTMGHILSKVAKDVQLEAVPRQQQRRRSSAALEAIPPLVPPPATSAVPQVEENWVAVPDSRKLPIAAPSPFMTRFHPEQEQLRRILATDLCSNCSGCMLCSKKEDQLEISSHALTIDDPKGSEKRQIVPSGARVYYGSKIALQAPNGKYLCRLKNGQFGLSDSLDLDQCGVYTLVHLDVPSDQGPSRYTDNVLLQLENEQWVVTQLNVDRMTRQSTLRLTTAEATTSNTHLGKWTLLPPSMDRSRPVLGMGMIRHMDQVVIEQDWNMLSASSTDDTIVLRQQSESPDSRVDIEPDPNSIWTVHIRSPVVKKTSRRDEQLLEKAARRIAASSRARVERPPAGTYLNAQKKYNKRRETAFEHLDTTRKTDYPTQLQHRQEIIASRDWHKGENLSRADAARIQSSANPQLIPVYSDHCGSARTRDNMSVSDGSTSDAADRAAEVRQERIRQGEAESIARGFESQVSMRVWANIADRVVSNADAAFKRRQRAAVKIQQAWRSFTRSKWRKEFVLADCHLYGSLEPDTDPAVVAAQVAATMLAATEPETAEKMRARLMSVARQMDDGSMEEYKPSGLSPRFQSLRRAEAAQARGGRKKLSKQMSAPASISTAMQFDADAGIVHWTDAHRLAFLYLHNPVFNDELPARKFHPNGRSMLERSKMSRPKSSPLVRTLSPSVSSTSSLRRPASAAASVVRSPTPATQTVTVTKLLSASASAVTTAPAAVASVQQEGRFPAPLLHGTGTGRSRSKSVSALGVSASTGVRPRRSTTAGSHPVLRPSRSAAGHL